MAGLKAGRRKVLYSQFRDIKDDIKAGATFKPYNWKDIHTNPDEYELPVKKVFEAAGLDARNHGHRQLMLYILCDLVAGSPATKWPNVWNEAQKDRLSSAAIKLKKADRSRTIRSIASELSGSFKIVASTGSSYPMTPESMADRLKLLIRDARKRETTGRSSSIQLALVRAFPRKGKIAVQR